MVGAEESRYLGTEHRYTAFGLELSIDARISVPGLGQSDEHVSAQLPSHLPARALCRVHLDATELRRRWDSLTAVPTRTREVRFEDEVVRTVDFAEPAGHLLWAQDCGRVLISPDGLELLCEPDPANEEWASILAAQALPLAATLRGLEVLHASGVVLAGRALLFAGPSGAGKSSLAAALARTGDSLLSDDVVALELNDRTLIAHPGSLALRLRENEKQRLQAEERAASNDRRDSIEPHHADRYAPAPAPLGGVFLLERSANEPAVERLEAVDPFELIASTFNLSVRTPERLRRQLDVVSVIASSGLAHRLRVQPGVDATLLVAHVQKHLAWMDR